MLTNLYNIENGESKLVLRMYVLTYIWMYVCTTINIEMDFSSILRTHIGTRYIARGGQQNFFNEIC